MRETDIIKKNLSAGAKLERALSVLTDSQLYEAAECLRTKSPGYVREFFEESFQKNALCPEMLKLSMLLSGDEKEKGAKKIEKACVSCIKNPLSLAASRKLCSNTGTVVISEEADFRSVCESTASKESDYGILPMCSSVDGYYPTFSKLLKSYDLKICNTCRITKNESDEEIQFALLSRKVEIPERPRFIAFSFVCDEPFLLPSLVGALSAEGCIPKSIISSPLEYNMDIFEHRIEALLGDVSPTALLFFLETALPRHIVLGIY